VDTSVFEFLAFENKLFDRRKEKKYPIPKTEMPTPV